jgi:uncharacterized protein YukE
MQATISKYEDARATMESAFSALEQAREHIDRCWDGPAKTLYLMKWANINANIRRSNDAIDAAVTSLNNVIATMDSTEEGNTSRAAALETGTTPPIF